MILLEPGNKVLAETVSQQIQPPEQTLDDGEVKHARQPIDIRLCDFDDTIYRIVIDTADLDTMRVSLALPCYGAIKAQGADDAVGKQFPGLVAATPDAGFDVTLAIPLAPLPSFATAEELVARLALLKHTALGGVYQHYFSALLSGAPLTQSFTFALRDDTTIYIIPRNDRVTIVYSIQFTDKTDSAIAKIFMSEFVEVKRRIGTAPPCTFSQHPPLELKEFNINENQANQTLGFLSFAVLKSHLENDRMAKVIGVLSSFRTYLHYHITCSKSYFHNRMRARVQSLLKILSRAKLEQPDKGEKKTITGKTFVRS